MKKAVFVCSAGDIQYQKWGAMTLQSVADHNSSVDLYWFYDNPIDLATLKPIAPPRTVFKQLDSKGYPFTMTPRAIEHLTDYDAVLALDLDVLVNRDVDELFNNPLSKIARVSSNWTTDTVDSFDETWEHVQWMRIAEQGHDVRMMYQALSLLEICFNSGVLLIDPKRYVNHVQEDIFEWSRLFGNTEWFFDQEFFNIVLDGQVELFDESINYRPFIESVENVQHEVWEWQRDMINGKAITHYVGHAKRWWTESQATLPELVHLIQNGQIEEANELSKGGIFCTMTPLFEYHEAIGIFNLSETEYNALKLIDQLVEQHFDSPDYERNP